LHVNVLQVEAEVQKKSEELIWEGLPPQEVELALANFRAEKMKAAKEAKALQSKLRKDGGATCSEASGEAAEEVDCDVAGSEFSGEAAAEAGGGVAPAPEPAPAAEPPAEPARLPPDATLLQVMEAPKFVLEDGRELQETWAKALRDRPDEDFLKRPEARGGQLHYALMAFLHSLEGKAKEVTEILGYAPDARYEWPRSSS
jgi:hypothetical protein